MVLALLSAFGYALDATLMAEYYRRCDAIDALMWRGLVLSVLGMPLLLTGGAEAYEQLAGYLPHLIAAGGTALTANFGYARATRSLPVGIVNAVVVALQVTCMALLGYLVYGETLSAFQTVAILGIVGLNIALCTGRYTSAHALTASSATGFANAVLNGAAQSATYMILIIIAREVDALLAAYLVETSITLWAVAIRLSGALVQRTPPPQRPELWRVTRASVWSIPALVLYALAARAHPAALVQAAFTSVAVFAAVAGAVVYRERLRVPQTAGLIALCVLAASVELQT